MKKRSHARRKATIGKCLSCGVKLTACGLPFTLTVPCPKCGAKNVYRDSATPIEVQR